jgi:hypothetical protein
VAQPGRSGAQGGRRAQRLLGQGRPAAPPRQTGRHHRQRWQQIHDLLNQGVELETRVAIIETSGAEPPTVDLVNRLAHPTDADIAAVDAWWRANNYLTVGQIYLMANPLLREPLTGEHI